ncbi:MAG: hypothetical protein QXT19_03405 [Candidatus Woesearchaeota archaeon]
MSWIVLLLIIIAVLALLGWFLKKIGGMIAMIISLALLLVVVVFGIWIGMDAYDLNKHFYKDNKLFILDIDAKPCGAFVLGADEFPGIITDLNKIREKYPDLSALKGNNYKVIVLKWPVVENDVEIMGFTASKSEIKEILLDENPKQRFAYFLLKGKGAAALAALMATFDAVYPINDAFSSSVFALLAVKPLQDRDLMYKGIKDGNVIIYPETATFKVMKALPLGVTKTLVPAK